MNSRKGFIRTILAAVVGVFVAPRTAASQTPVVERDEGSDAHRDWDGDTVAVRMTVSLPRTVHAPEGRRYAAYMELPAEVADELGLRTAGELAASAVSYEMVRDGVRLNR